MITDTFLPLALAFIMFSLGMTLVPADFLRVFSSARAMGMGLLGQLICVPLFGFLVVILLGLEGEMALGVMILAACPGGASSGLLTRLAGGETALSISLTAVSSVAAAMTMPVLVGFALTHFMAASVPVDLSVTRMVRGVFLLTTVPVLLGMGLRHVRPALSARLTPATDKLSTLLFVVIVIATFVNQREILLAHLPTIGPAMLFLNVLNMVVGFALGAATGLVTAGRIAIAMECGLHNAGLGIFVSLTLLQVPALVVPSVVYALLMNVGAVALVFLMRRRTTV